MDKQQLSTWIKELEAGTSTLPEEKPKPPKPPLPPFEAPPRPAYQPTFTPPRKRPEIGEASVKYGHLGVWILCLGPFSTKLAGDRFNVVVLDRECRVKRRLASVPAFKVREASEDDPDVLVDFDELGQMNEILNDDFETLCFDRQRYLSLIGQWAHKHGRREYAF